MCKQCLDNMGTYWELWVCDMNPTGSIPEPRPHGNDDCCEDNYCNPQTFNWDYKPSKYQLENFELHERCNTCDTMIESLG